MDTTAQWPQGIGVVKQVEEGRGTSDQRRPRPQKEQALNCPRCNSTNTKFCYYNNYSLSQPRYFCKTCRRYWTEGGTLRTVPVGGGSRKNKRSSSAISTSQSPSSSKKLIDHHATSSAATVSHLSAPHNPITTATYPGQDLNLGYSPLTTYDQYNKTMELLKNGPIQSVGMNSFMFPMAGPCSNLNFPPEFSLQEFKPTLNFSLNGINQNDYENLQETTPRPFFPFNDLKQAQNPDDHDQIEQNREQGETNGYWSGMLNEGSW